MTTIAQHRRQLPTGSELFLDHVGHFVADADTARSALARAGFAPTPTSVQVNPDPAGGTPSLTGTGNVCAMLEAGYLEMLFKTADTPLGAELDGARARYPGLHLAAFAIADPAAAHARLAQAGFRMQPIVHMQRPVETSDGPDTAAFKVVRLEPGQMPEGRLQVLEHLTERTVWQPRWLAHPNTASGLTALEIAVPDLAEATRRYERFLGRVAVVGPGRATVALDRGAIELVTPERFKARWPGLAIPALPFMGACTIAVRSLDAAAAALGAGGLAFERQAERIVAAFPVELGVGVWAFVPSPEDAVP